MSKAPPESAENSAARTIRRAISALTGTGPAPASRLMRDSSESALCGLIARSMRCISSITAVIAASPAARSSLHSSTLIAVPMIASSRFIPARASGLRGSSGGDAQGSGEAEDGGGAFARRSVRKENGRFDIQAVVFGPADSTQK